MAISAGIGLFLALISLDNAGIATEYRATPVILGDLGAPGASTDDIGLAFITHAVVATLGGKGRNSSPAVTIFGLPFAVEFAFTRGPQ